jgi:glycogen operon protein
MRSVIHIRRTRPLLRQRRFLHGRKDENDISDILWWRPDGDLMEQDDWDNPENRALGMLLGSPETHLFLILNAHDEDVVFRLPSAPSGHWRLLVDTARGLADPGSGEPVSTTPMKVAHRSLRLLEWVA